MKVVCVFFLCVCASLASLASAHTVPSSCDAPDSVKELYRADAAWSAIFDPFYRINPFYKDSLDIPMQRADLMLGAILAVKNALPFFGAEVAHYTDSVHQSQSVALHEFYMNVDTTYNWCKRLAQKQFPTGNVVFDSLYKQYSISLYDLVQYPGQDSIAVIFFKTKDDCNAIALANKISSLEGVEFCSWALPFYTEKHWLHAEKSDTGFIVTFSYAWRCNSTSCDYRHYWMFIVTEDCMVTLKTSFGNQLPPLFVRNDNLSLHSLYPNPVTDKLIIEAEERGIVVISNVNGIELRTLAISEGKNEIVVSELPSGMYFVTIRDRNGNVSTGRFIKM